MVDRTNSEPTPGPARLDVIQVLRFAAAASVVVAHSESRMARVFPDLADTTVLFQVGHLRTWGHFGVDLFFVISGFIMFWVARTRFGQARFVPEFLIKRVVRIVPIYWLLTAFAVVLLAVAPGLFSYRQSTDPSWITASFLFVPWRAPEGFISPVLGLGWTLNYEMYFYLCFSLALLLPQRRALKVITVVFLGCVLLGQVFEPQVPVLRQATSWLLLEFVLGLWMGWLYTTHASAVMRFGRRVGPAALALLVATVFVHPTEIAGEAHADGLRTLLWGVPCAAILLWSLSFRWTPTSSSWGGRLVALGDASYSIYLLQVFTLPGLGLAFRLAHLDRYVPFDLLVVLLSIGSLMLGYLFYRVVERPLTRVCSKFVTKPHPQPSDISGARSTSTVSNAVRRSEAA